MTNTALLIIDVQQGFDAPYWGARNNRQAEDNIARLLETWRAAKRPVFHVKHNSRTPQSPLHPSKPGNAYKDFATRWRALHRQGRQQRLHWHRSRSATPRR